MGRHLASDTALVHAGTPARGLVGVALALALAGCAAGENLDGSFGAQDTGVATGRAAGVTSAATPALTVGSGPDAITYACPSVTVRNGAGTWQVTEGGALRYQGNVGQLARECAIAGQTMTIKVGIEGRVLMGEKGTPGTVRVPVRLAVVEEGPNPKTITTKFFTVPVEIAAGQQQAAFTVVEDQLSFPLPKPEEVERYVVYVGYDPQGEKPKPTSSRPRTPTKPKPKPAASEAAPAAPAPAAAAPKSDPGDVFGPPPGAPSSSSSGSSSSGSSFSTPPSSSAFEPPPR
ncbi:hypothetical protein [Xanthobacter agilis]|uniref:Lipoprotein n=1 Tax=Xanthobacter agilis TaxID=47492 RepID=A0ABU0LEB9_XANAG|nr:hypothetical protein [Xanthobacter agilis]MDQ0505497.1 hypothetical protein [Xanthobacter agilis]